MGAGERLRLALDEYPEAEIEQLVLSAGDSGFESGHETLATAGQEPGEHKVVGDLPFDVVADVVIAEKPNHSFGEL